MTKSTEVRSDPPHVKIHPVPPELAESSEYASKFPLEGKVDFLGLGPDCNAILSGLGIELVRDFFRKGYTYYRINQECPITIADNVNEALSKKKLPLLSNNKPDHALYAFYDPQKRTQLSLEHIKVLGNCEWGNIKQEVMAKEMNVDMETIENLIRDAYEILHS